MKNVLVLTLFLPGGRSKLEAAQQLSLMKYWIPLVFICCLALFPFLYMHCVRSSSLWYDLESSHRNT